MSSDLAGEVTRLLRRIASGEESAKDELANTVYGSLHGIAERLMARERPDHMLQPSALINEAWMRLEKGKLFQSPRNRQYFYAAAAQAMRRILVEHARRPNPKSDEVQQSGIAIDALIEQLDQERIDVLALTDTLKTLEELHSRQHEIVQLKFFARLTNKEIADILSVSVGTVEKDYRSARVWLYRKLVEHDNNEC